MAIIKAISSRASLGNAVNYVTKDEKTEIKLVSGKNCSPETAIDEMKTTKAIYNKTDKRQYYHFVQSFSPEEKITPDEAHQIAKELADKRFKGYEVVIATHKDKEHTHTHFIVNSVNADTGYKLHWSKNDLQKMKDMSDEICRTYGKSICEKGEEITSYNLNKYKALERAVKTDYKSYVLDCYNAVLEVKEKAISKDDFIKKMQEKGYQTKWTEKRKYITFTDKDGNKIRNNKLEKDFKEKFSKGDLERGFEINFERADTERQAREEMERARKLNQSVKQNNTGTIIDNLNATIRSAEQSIRADESERINRIAKEQSFKREQDRIREQKIISRNKKGFEFER